LGINKIAVIGLGYVGLPVAMAFAEKYRVIGFDLSNQRVNELRKGQDHTREADEIQLQLLYRSFHHNTQAAGLNFTNDPYELVTCNIYIIAVPTPVTKQNEPDLRLLEEASRSVGITLKENDLVIYESTVYPGCTEEIGVPILEKFSGLRFNKDFFCGYSPERINPGDKTRTITQIQKITSGSTPEAAKRVDELYASIITAGTYLAPSIKVAEAAKVIENTQRDINIAFVNELSKIFNLLSIDTHEVLKAAGTKWNFLPFQPGLVGGHCIGIDPYYLAHKAISVGYHPEIILSARKVNDSMGSYVADQVVKLMAKKQVFKPGAEVLVMGITFKENFSDVRNSKVVDIIHSLSEYHLKITIYDPWASPSAVKETYGLSNLTGEDFATKFAAIIIAVNHDCFQEMELSSLLVDNGIFYDVKGRLKNIRSDGKL